MTTIAFKDGLFAADSKVSGNGTLQGYIKKIKQIGKIYIACCGSEPACIEFEKFIAGKKYNKEVFSEEGSKNFQALIVNKKTKSVSIYYNCLIECPCDFDFYAIGSGNELAKGAMLMGASAKQAVEAAAKLDVYTGGDIQFVRVW